MNEIPTDLRCPKKLAKALDVSSSTIRRWIRTGKLPAYRIGGRWRASEAEAKALIVKR